MIYVTHDQTEAMALADKIVLLHAGEHMLKHGSIAQVGAPLDLYHHPRNLFVAGFLGSPTMNFMSGRFVGVEGGMARERLLDGQAVAVAVSIAGLQPDAPVTLGIRPEHLGSNHAGEPQTLTRKIEVVEQFGEHGLVYLRSTTGEALVAKVAGGAFTSGSAEATFAAPPEAFHLFDAEGLALPRQAAG
jgi:multiple sugar transport system ATP-binding protein